MVLTILIVLIVLIAVGLIVSAVFRATRKGGNPGGEHSDATPAGDTPEHAGRQTSDGATTGGQDAGQHGGSGTPVHSGYAGTSAPRVDEDDPDAVAHVARPGEGEGAAHTEFDGQRPER